MLFKGWSCAVANQKDGLLFFDECKKCKRLSNVIYFKMAFAKMVSDNKENDPNWRDIYYDYILELYKLDYHCNKIHKKKKCRKLYLGEVYKIGRIIILNELSDYHVDNMLDIVVDWTR